MNDYLPVSEQVRLLFEVVTHPEGRPYTMQEVSEQTGISLATISQLRTGRIKNPQLNTVRALCQFFHVPLRYFETCSIEQCYAILAQHDEPPTPQVNEITLRVNRLAPSSQRNVLTLIKWIQAAEHEYNGNIPMPDLETDDEA